MCLGRVKSSEKRRACLTGVDEKVSLRGPPILLIRSVDFGRKVHLLMFKPMKKERTLTEIPTDIV